MINALIARIAELERKLANMLPVGPVHEVDAKRKMYRQRIGGTDEKPLLSPWVPYSQHVGKLKFHLPVTVGQNMMLLCPNGDPQQGCGIAMTENSKMLSPSDKGDENVIAYGDVSIRMKADELHVKRAGQEIHFQPGGGMTVKAGDNTLMMAPDGTTTMTAGKIVLDGPVSMPKGFTAGGGAGAAQINGSIRVTNTIEAGEKVSAPVIEGNWTGR